MMTLRWIFIVGLVAAVAPACSRDNPAAPGADTDADETLPAGFTISNVVHGDVSESRVVAARAVASAYVSAAPHTYAEPAEAASIRNITARGAPINRPLADGGFDPVRIDGQEGDEISISIYGHTDKLSEVKVKVPPRRPPRIVRTFPDKGRVDVALNVVIEVVFTEPIDPASVNNTSVAVLRDGAAIPGTLRVRNGSLIAEFTPESPLQPGAEYTLSVSQEVRDLDREPLSEPAVVSFKTIAGQSSLKTLVVSTTTTSLSGGPVDPDGYLIQLDSRPPVRIATNGTQSFTDVVPGVHNLRITDLSANCETEEATRLVGVPAGATALSHYDVICKPQAVLEGMLAFVSDRDGNPEIYTSNADGTGLRRLTSNTVADLSPAWSPDGTKIAFTRDHWIYTMNADGSNVVQVSNGLSDGEPAWSPDGNQIAYAGLGGIYIQRLDQPLRSPEQLGYPSSWNSHPSWSSDGQFILFGSDYGTGDSWHLLWRVRSDDLHAPARYVNLGDTRTTVYMLPTWSPDASHFAFAQCDWFYLCYGPGSLAIANADGSGITRLGDIDDIDGITWSPDGSIIAYSSRGCSLCTSPSIYHVTTDGRMKGLVISDAYMPAWRPVP